MEVNEGRVGNSTTLQIMGRVDSSVAKILQQRVEELMSRDEHIVVDLAGMTYVSSAGLRSFIILAKHAKANNRTIVLAAMQPAVVELFELSGLLELFSVHDTLDAAVAALPQ